MMRDYLICTIFKIVIIRFEKKFHMFISFYIKKFHVFISFYAVRNKLHATVCHDVNQVYYT